MLDDYLELKESIEKETGFALTFEGIHKWIAFIHSKQNDILPVPNRYFGVYQDGTLIFKYVTSQPWVTLPSRHIKTLATYCDVTTRGHDSLGERKNPRLSGLYWRPDLWPACILYIVTHKYYHR